MTVCLIGTLPTLMLVYMHIHTRALFSQERLFSDHNEYVKAIIRVKAVNLELAHFPDGMLMCKTSEAQPRNIKSAPYLDLLISLRKTIVIMFC